MPRLGTQGDFNTVLECQHKEFMEAKKAVSLITKEKVMAVCFWVGVSEPALLGTYLLGTGVRDKWLVGIKLNA